MELKETHIEDIEDIVLKIENSFEFNFDEKELLNVKTYGELCDAVMSKIEHENTDECTSQQAFYKLRKAIVKFSQLQEKNISPKTNLTEIFPKKNRIKRIKEIEEELNIKLSILRPSGFVSGTLIILLIVSFIGFFFSWKLPLIGLIITIFGLRIAFKTGKILDLETIGQVSEKMTRENYIKSRRDAKTVNRKEVEKVISDLFTDNLFLDKSKLTREAELY